MKMTSTSCVRIAALLSLSLLVHTGAAAQAYVDQVNRGVGNGAYVEQMPAGAKPATQKQTSPNKTKPYSQSSRSAKPGKASAAQAAGADIVPTVGTGSSAVVTLSAGELEWPTVGRGTVNR